jgi:MFS family permease
MVEFRFFSNRNFLGAVVVASIVSFSMLGVFFFLALYMQDILRYSPLEAGVRFLPSTLMIVGLAPIAGRLADRFGPRWLIAAGLVVVSASLYSFSGIAVDSSYLDLLPGFMLLGIGIALTMSPMTSAAMNAVPVEKAGIASGVLSMFRMVGGSLGVAVTGAIFQGSVGASFADASPQQFVDALGHAMSVCAVVALAGAVIGAAAIRARRDPLSVEAVEAAVNPGGEELAGREAVAVGEPVA